MVIFILVGGWLVYSAIRFRARPGRPIDPPQVHGSSRLEWGWTIVPVLILIGLAGYTFHKLPDVKDAPSDSMIVNVTAQQFSFSYRYGPNSGAAEGKAPSTPATLVVPEDCPAAASGSSPRRTRRGNRVSSRRALCAHLRDQHEPLHLLRLLRARVPVRRDHARQRVRDLRVLARRPHLHEGHAARGADQAAFRSPTAQLFDTPDSGLQEHPPIVPWMGNFLVWVVWFRRGLRVPWRPASRSITFTQPVLLGARADREPRLARGAVPATRRRSSSPPPRCSSTRGP